jgi:hypothetical protein
MNLRVRPRCPYVDSFTDLRAKLDAERVKYHQALDGQREVFQRYTGLPHPDGS